LHSVPGLLNDGGVVGFGMSARAVAV
jgi:hypothetical protein